MMNEFHFGPIFGSDYINEVKGEAEAYNSRRIGYERASHEHKNGFIKKCAEKDNEDAKRNNTHHEPMKTAQDYKERQKHANHLKRNADNINNYREIEHLSKKYTSNNNKASNESVDFEKGELNMSKNEFHFGPLFESNYLEEKCKSGKGSGCKSCSEEEENKDLKIDDKELDECGDNKKNVKEAAYNGKAIEKDEDPTEPSLDDIVNTEEDIAANYHFGPAFGQQSIFHDESKKRYRS